MRFIFSRNRSSSLFSSRYVHSLIQVNIITKGFLYTIFIYNNKKFFKSYNFFCNGIFCLLLFTCSTTWISCPSAGGTSVVNMVNTEPRSHVVWIGLLKCRTSTYHKRYCISINRKNCHVTHIIHISGSSSHSITSSTRSIGSCTLGIKSLIFSLFKLPKSTNFWLVSIIPYLMGNLLLDSQKQC